MTANANMILAHGLTYPTILASTPLLGCSDNSGRAMMHTTYPELQPVDLHAVVRKV